MSNLVQLSIYRDKAERRSKIEKLKQSISEKKEILKIRETYLNNLSRFQKYDTIRIECHDIDRNNSELEITIGIMEAKLIKLEKELDE